MDTNTQAARRSVLRRLTEYSSNTKGLNDYVDFEGEERVKALKKRAVSSNTYSGPGTGHWGTVPNVLAHREKKITNAQSIHTQKVREVERPSSLSTYFKTCL